MSIIFYDQRGYNLSAIPVIYQTRREVKCDDGSIRVLLGYVLDNPPNELAFIPETSTAYWKIFKYISHKEYS